jgi:hypothetical protein
MGLDMYLTGERYFFEHKVPRRVTEDGFPIESERLALGYWRKHPNLHGYIVKTFADNTDNCQAIDLSADDIKDILSAISSERLPFTEGFFFGRSENTQEERDEDTVIFTKALEWLTSPDPAEAFRTVEYRASW